MVLTATTGVASILFFFSIYWLLPNRKVPWRSVLRTSIYTGFVWLAARYVFVLVLPHLDLRALYGPFFISVGLLFWAYVSGLILFAGAQFSVARMGDRGKASYLDRNLKSPDEHGKRCSHGFSSERQFSVRVAEMIR